MEYYCCDVETTGIDVSKHELTEISILRCKDLRQKTWHIKIKHPENCDKFALDITGKTIEYLTNNGKYLDEVIDEINFFIEEDGKSSRDRVIIAHNYSFDQRFLETHWKNLGKIFPADLWECTMEMAKKYMRLTEPGIKQSAKLEMLVKKYGIKYEKNMHGASVDVRNMYKLRDFLIKRGINEIEFIKHSKAASERKQNTKVASSTQIDDVAMKEMFGEGAFDFGMEDSEDDS